MARHRLVPISRHEDDRGSIVILDSSTDADFKVRRTYAISQVPEDSVRGGHAHRSLHQILVPVVGRVTVDVYDGEVDETYHLDSPYQGLFLGRMVWRELRNFSSDAVLLVAASADYDQEDYIRDRNKFYDEYIAEVSAATATTATIAVF